MSRKTFAIALMDPPYESENLTTAFRLLDIAARRGFKINVFAYEGASALAFVKQAHIRIPSTARTWPRRTIPRRRIRSPRSSPVQRRTAARSTG